MSRHSDICQEMREFRRVVTLCCVYFQAEPELPEGLKLNRHTGGISGRPVKLTQETRCRITCTNIAGAVCTELVIEVTQLNK
jgi:hypothetical protein